MSVHQDLAEVAVVGWFVVATATAQDVIRRGFARREVRRAARAAELRADMEWADTLAAMQRFHDGLGSLRGPDRYAALKSPTPGGRIGTLGGQR